MEKFYNYEDVKDHYQSIDRCFIIGYIVLIVIAVGLCLYGVFADQDGFALLGAALAVSTFVSILHPTAGMITWAVLLVLCLVFCPAETDPEVLEKMELMGRDYDSVKDLLFFGLLVILPILTYMQSQYRKEWYAALRRIHAANKRDRQS